MQFDDAAANTFCSNWTDESSSDSATEEADNGILLRRNRNQSVMDALRNR
jgi:hypothetical protein